MKTILLTGQTGAISPEIIEFLSVRFSLVITSDGSHDSAITAKVHQVQPGSPFFEELFWSYDFYAVWYFSPFCGDSSLSGDTKELNTICRLCREASVRHLLVVSSSMISQSVRLAEESLVLQSTRSLPQSAILRVPFLLSDNNREGGIGKLFSQIYHRKREIYIPSIEEDNYEFLPIRSLIRLMVRMTLSFAGEGTFVLPGEYILSGKELNKEIRSRVPRSHIRHEKPGLSYMEPENIKVLSEHYAYTVKDQKKLDFSSLYDAYASRKRREGGRGILSGLRRVRGRIPSTLLVVLDTIVLFLAAEYLARFTAGSVYFKTIDVRLIFILLIATFHGLVPGVIAALCECVVLLFQFQQLGISSTQLFYNVENWIPFVLYIIMGAITGFFSDLRENEKALVARENILLREKYLFLNDIYNSTLEVKDAYRYQILSFDQSYGKICQAVMDLEQDTVPDVLNRGWEILADLLDNRSIIIYRKNRDGSAEAVSGLDHAKIYRRTYLSQDELEIARPCLEEGRVWRNTHFEHHLPFFCFDLPVSEWDPADETGLGYLIVIWDALPEQMNDYYSNRFEMLSRLVGRAVDRAYLVQSSGRV